MRHSRIKATLKEAFAKARAAGWSTRLHKPVTARPYYSIRRKGKVYSTKGSSTKLHDALWLLVQRYAISDEEATRRAESERRISLAASRMTVSYESPSYKDRRKVTA